MGVEKWGTRSLERQPKNSFSTINKKWEWAESL